MAEKDGQNGYCGGWVGKVLKNNKKFINRNSIVEALSISTAGLLAFMVWKPSLTMFLVIVDLILSTILFAYYRIGYNTGL